LSSAIRVIVNFAATAAKLADAILKGDPEDIG
jgi:hypothetical protein